MAYGPLQNESVYCDLLEIPGFKDNIHNVQGDESVYLLPSEEVMDSTTQEAERRGLCNNCVHALEQALKYCQSCDAHMCDHIKSAEDVITDSTNSLVTRKDCKCPKHKEILKFYCPEAGTCLCVPCYLDGTHEKKQIEMLDEASQRKRKDILMEITATQNKIEEKVHRLHKQTADVDDKAAEISERVTTLFRHIRKQLDDLEIRVLSEISMEQKKNSRPFSLLIKDLELQQTDLSDKLKNMEALCNLGNPLNGFTLGQNIEDIKGREYMINDAKDFDEGLISATLQRSLDNIMTGIKWENSVSELFMDVNTAANNVYLSGDKKIVSWTQIKQGRQKSSNRFKRHQVLGNKSFSSGRHYWEVETSETGKWIIGMSYPSIYKKGDQSFIGKNNKSWGLGKLEKYKVVHDSEENHIPCLATIRKIGIYLDYEGGQLSFYELCDPVRHLHTYNAKFTEPLYPIFWVWYSWVKLKS